MQIHNGKAAQTLAIDVQPPTIDVQPPAIEVQPPAIDVQPPAIDMQPPAIDVQPPATDMQPPAIDMQPPAIDMQPPAIDMQLAATDMQSSAGKSHRKRSGFASDASIDARLVAAQVAIDKVLGDPQLQSCMAAHGYPATRMLQGRALRDQALALHNQQQVAYGAQIAATDTRMAAQNQAKISYTSYIATARVALRGNRSAARTLDLDTRRKRTRAGWLIQARQFYTNLLDDPALVASMTEYGVTYEQLASAQQALVAIEAALTMQQSSKEVAKKATRSCNLGLKALSRWMLDFQAITRVVLAEQKRL